MEALNEGSAFQSALALFQPRGGWNTQGVGSLGRTAVLRFEPRHVCSIVWMVWLGDQTV